MNPNEGDVDDAVAAFLELPLTIRMELAAGTLTAAAASLSMELDSRWSPADVVSAAKQLALAEAAQRKLEQDREDMIAMLTRDVHRALTPSVSPDVQERFLPRPEIIAARAERIARHLVDNGWRSDFAAPAGAVNGQ